MLVYMYEKDPTRKCKSRPTSHLDFQCLPNWYLSVIVLHVCTYSQHNPLVMHAQNPGRIHSIHKDNLINLNELYM